MKKAMSEWFISIYIYYMMFPSLGLCFLFFLPWFYHTNIHIYPYDYKYKTNMLSIGFIMKVGKSSIITKIVDWQVSINTNK